MIALLSFAGFADISQHYLTIFDRACKCESASFVRHFIDIKISIWGKENDSFPASGALGGCPGPSGCGPIKSGITIAQRRPHEKREPHKKRHSSRKVYTKSDISCMDFHRLPFFRHGLLEIQKKDDILCAPC
jgi:hypothetical protein